MRGWVLRNGGLGSKPKARPAGRQAPPICAGPFIRRGGSDGIKVGRSPEYRQGLLQSGRQAGLNARKGEVHGQDGLDRAGQDRQVEIPVFDSSSGPGVGSGRQPETNVEKTCAEEGKRAGQVNDAQAGVALLGGLKECIP